MSVTRAQTRANYDRLSRWYDLLAGASERACRQLGVHKLNVQKGERVLEIGPGTGQSLLSLGIAAGLSGRVWGVDLSPGMCRVAHRRLLQMNPPDYRVTVACGDAVDLPFQDATFSAALMSFTLELFAEGEIARVLMECRRVLCENGRLAVVALAERDGRGLMQRLYSNAHDRFPGWVDCRPIAVKTVLSGARFDIVDTVSGSIWGLPVEIVAAVKDGAK